MTSKEIAGLLAADGWMEIPSRGSGSHRHYRHGQKPGKIVVPQADDIPQTTLRRIEAQAGIPLAGGELVVKEQK